MPTKYARCALAFLLILPLCLQAAAFKVHPLSLSLNAKKKSTVLKIQNTSEGVVSVQLQSMQWGQDENGKDVYQPTADIIFFPKIATIKPGEERLVRIGYRGRNPRRKALFYRMFVQQLPVSEAGGGALNFMLRFSIPLFVESRKQGQTFSIAGLRVDRQQATVRIKNPGRQHLIVNRLVARLRESGSPVTDIQQGGWYVLPGVVREFSIPLGEQCARADQLKMTVEVGQHTQQKSVAVNRGDCLPEKQ